MSQDISSDLRDQHVGWFESPDGRGTSDLLWTCLATLIISTWTVQHADIIWPHYKGWLNINTRRLRLAAFCLLLPEYMTAVAIEQCTNALLYRKKFRAIKGLEEWTVTHGFFATMNGFRIQTPDGKIIAVRINELHWLLKAGLIKKMPAIKQKDPEEARFSPFSALSQQAIMRCSKADGIVKLVACIQCGWFLTQLVARVAQQLPVSPLEITTFSFTLICLVTYAFWWEKPCDVEYWVTLTVTENRDQWWSLMTKELDIDKNREEELVRHWTGAGDLHLHAQTKLHASLTFTLGAIFGALHFLAWNIEFPTEIESTLWRVSSVITTVWPVYMLLTIEPVLKRLGNIHRCFLSWKHTDLTWKPIRYAQYAFVFAMVLGRLYLIVEGFASLRSLSKGCYDTPQWQNFLPHI
ncbi:hypothetical protein QBC38DRAFT_485421 [Podospora fimiseda]|uniref:Uncharacterized protein n=1 Tax=Podospora fimiseda TaxID=252190 RepID=A0AAN7BJM1_9PEZI|nr:hypothetical protein QBC38DRAFT_485421 [Podospora fimiseda]